MPPVPKTAKVRKCNVPLLSGCVVEYTTTTGVPSRERLAVTETLPSNRDKGNTRTMGRMPQFTSTAQNEGACSKESCGATLLKLNDKEYVPEESASEYG
jgi:hypothetical protein